MFLQMGEPLSILKTHFSEPAQWKYIEIIKPEVVDESVLIEAQHLGKKIIQRCRSGEPKQHVPKHSQKFTHVEKRTGRVSEGCRYRELSGDK